MAFTPLSCPSPQPRQDPVPRSRTDERGGCLLSWGNWTKGSWQNATQTLSPAVRPLARSNCCELQKESLMSLCFRVNTILILSHKDFAWFASCKYHFKSMWMESAGTVAVRWSSERSCTTRVTQQSTSQPCCGNSFPKTGKSKHAHPKPDGFNRRPARGGQRSATFTTNALWSDSSHFPESLDDILDCREQN